MEMRQRTKQLCYGMIYGMGVKSLAENLCISEPEAQEFLESFMSTYPGIYKWLNDVLEKAHRDVYVTTLLGRRRQLPDLQSTKSSTRGELIVAYYRQVLLRFVNILITYLSTKFSTSRTASCEHKSTRLRSRYSQKGYDKHRREDKMQLPGFGYYISRGAYHSQTAK